MSTRCHIIFKTKPFSDGKPNYYPVAIYKHSDGYPEGVLPFLEPFAKTFVERRGDDLNYMVAQTLRQWVIADLKEDPNCVYTKDLLGWGVLPFDPDDGGGLHWDVAYVYIVDGHTGAVTTHKQDSFLGSFSKWFKGIL